MSGARFRAAAYPELAGALVATGIGLGVQSPLRWLDNRHGVDVLLAVLVFATALTIEPADVGGAGRAWRRSALALAVGVTVLPVLAWGASLLVPTGSLRDGVLTLGLAPCEIASVATTAMAGGAAAISASVLVGSTLATVVLAGPILSLETGRAAADPVGIVAHLALVVALPLAIGIVARALIPGARRAAPTANAVAVLTVAALVALVAAEVPLSARYLPVVAALAVFLAGSAVLGFFLGRGTPPAAGRALLLTTSMRDFAVAAATLALAPSVRPRRLPLAPTGSSCSCGALRPPVACASAHRPPTWRCPARLAPASPAPTPCDREAPGDDRGRRWTMPDGAACVVGASTAGAWSPRCPTCATSSPDVQNAGHSPSGSAGPVSGSYCTHRHRNATGWCTHHRVFRLPCLLVCCRADVLRPPPRGLADDLDVGAAVHGRLLS